MEEELEKLVLQQEAKFRKVFNEWISEKRSQETLRQLQELLERGQIERALDLMVDSQNYWPLLFLQIYVAGGVWEALKSPYDFRFDPINSIDFPRSQSLSFHTFIANSQKQALRDVAYREYIAGKSWREIAKAIQDRVGLSQRQINTLQTYEELLRSKVDADGKKEFTEAQIVRMLRTRRNQLIETRSKFLAREEVDTLIAQARDDAAQQAAILFEIQPEKEWVSRRDDRVRPTHQHGSLDGQKKPLNEPFISSSGARMMHPKDRSLGAGNSEIMGCRCRALYHYKD